MYIYTHFLCALFKVEVYQEYISTIYTLKEDLVGLLGMHICITYLTNSIQPVFVCVDTYSHTLYPRERLTNVT